jgi:hypothetical protein
MQEPRLRTVEKYRPPFPLNDLPADFALKLGREVVYHLATRTAPILEGTDWEQIFARIIGAAWKPSNVGLDDVVLEQTAWGAKTVKNDNPASVSRIRLICGRNSPVYSYGDREVSECDPNELGEKVLSIWNERVTAIRARYKHLRSVVLVKSDDLLELAVFEYETLAFSPNQFDWRWNKRNNLEGFQKKDDAHKFTWQPHGSQFTIIENVPPERLAIRIKQSPYLNQDEVLTALNFDASWIEIIKSNQISPPSGDNLEF